MIKSPPGSCQVVMSRTSWSPRFLLLPNIASYLPLQVMINPPLCRPTCPPPQQEFFASQIGLVVFETKYANLFLHNFPPTHPPKLTTPSVWAWARDWCFFIVGCQILVCSYP